MNLLNVKCFWTFVFSVSVVRCGTDRTVLFPSHVNACIDCELLIEGVLFSLTPYLHSFNLIIPEDAVHEAAV